MYLTNSAACWIITDFTDTNKVTFSLGHIGVILAWNEFLETPQNYLNFVLGVIFCWFLYLKIPNQVNL